MRTLRTSLVLAALAVASPAGAETSAELATSFADAMTSGAKSDDVVFHKLIEFAPASARVYSRDRAVIQRLAKTWVQSDRDSMIVVHGYSDSLDLGLAERRAEVVRGYLIKAGIAAERVVAIGHTLDKEGRRIDLAIGKPTAK